MYRINENDAFTKKTLLIPAMLDVHFPLMRYAFYSPKYRHVILANEDGITEIGLRYVHNDMCYHGIPKVLGVQPFGCMPSHVFGRGQYAAIARKLHGQLVSVDFDSGLPLVNIRNRIRLLIDGDS